LNRLLPELNLEEENIASEVLDELVVIINDFENAVRDIMSSADQFYHFTDDIIVTSEDKSLTLSIA
jgi:hypothetical protein